jgi:putative spermidine/putrescine transport system substrate-binding protein
MERRTFLTGAAKVGAAVTVGAPLLMSTQARAAESITFVSWGGSYGDFVKEYWMKPFTKETGIDVVYVSGPDLARAKAQVQTNNVEWDIFDAPGSLAMAGVKEGLWEPVDTKLIDPGRFVKWVSPVLMPGYMFVGGIAHDTTRSKNAPTTFKELWDVQKFPGRRAFRTRSSETLEAALLADGVPPEKLYPLDIERAFKSLEKIKPHVKKWFSETAQGISLIQTNEVDYSYTYTSRVKAASESGIPLDISLKQCIAGMNYFPIVKGSKKKNEAMKFLEFITRPAQQVVLPKIAGVPAIKGADKGMDPAAKRWIPDLTNPNNVILNDEYWGEHFVAVDKRFKEWILT